MGIIQQGMFTHPKKQSCQILLWHFPLSRFWGPVPPTRTPREHTESPRVEMKHKYCISCVNFEDQPASASNSEIGFFLIPTMVRLHFLTAHAGQLMCKRHCGITEEYETAAPRERRSSELSRPLLTAN